LRFGKYLWYNEFIQRDKRSTNLAQVANIPFSAEVRTARFAHATDRSE
jgi:hypothetical protein